MSVASKPLQWEIKAFADDLRRLVSLLLAWNVDVFRGPSEDYEPNDPRIFLWTRPTILDEAKSYVSKPEPTAECALTREEYYLGRDRVRALWLLGKIIHQAENTVDNTLVSYILYTIEQFCNTSVWKTETMWFESMSDQAKKKFPPGVRLLLRVVPTQIDQMLLSVLSDESERMLTLANEASAQLSPGVSENLTGSEKPPIVRKKRGRKPLPPEVVEDRERLCLQYRQVKASRGLTKAQFLQEVGRPKDLLLLEGGRKSVERKTRKLKQPEQKKGGNK